MRRLLVAVRDLDPPGGGAERSLAALINGLARPGPVASTAPEFLPAVPAETVDTHDAWEVRALSSKCRGAATDLLDEAVKAERLALPIEGPWSRAAWALRQRGGLAGRATGRIAATLSTKQAIRDRSGSMAVLHRPGHRINAT